MAHRDIVVIGASAGGLQALQQILSAMPRDVEAALLAVLHTADHSGSMLPQILQRRSNMPVSHPCDPIQRGRVYIAPPGFHMIVEQGFLRVLQGPRENLHRPAIEPLFRSAAAAYGRRVIGVILTGMLGDGTAGLMVVSARAGEAIVSGSGKRFLSFHAEKCVGSSAECTCTATGPDRGLPVATHWGGAAF